MTAPVHIKPNFDSFVNDIFCLNSIQKRTIFSFISHCILSFPPESYDVQNMLIICIK